MNMNRFNRLWAVICVIALSFMIMTGVSANMSLDRWIERSQARTRNPNHSLLTVPAFGFTVYKSPQDRIVMAGSPFSRIIYDLFDCSLCTSDLYLDAEGMLWGQYNYWYESYGIYGTFYTGWAQMFNMHLYYDERAFVWEHEDEFVLPSDFVSSDGLMLQDYSWAKTENILDYDGDWSDSVQVQVMDYGPDGFTLWAYPGAPEPVRTNWTNYDRSSDLEYVVSVWTDEHGIAWGHLNRGSFNDGYWFVLDDPSRDSIPERDVSGIEQYFSSISLTRGREFVSRADSKSVFTSGLIWIDSSMPAVVIVIMIGTACVSGAAWALLNKFWPVVIRGTRPRRGMLTRRGGGSIRPGGRE